MRLLTAVSSVRVCQGQPTKENTHQKMGVFLLPSVPDGVNLDESSVTRPIASGRSLCRRVAPYESLPLTDLNR